MAVLAQFDTLKFEITSRSATLIQGIKMSAGCDTEDESDEKKGYVTRSNGQPLEISFTAVLNAALGVDVKSAVTSILSAAKNGTQSYLYIAGEKIFQFKLMIVKAETEEIVLSPSGAWVRTNVNITLKQSSKDSGSGGGDKGGGKGDGKGDGGSGGGSSGGGGGSNKASVNTSPTTTTTTTTYIKPPSTDGWQARKEGELLGIEPSASTTTNYQPLTQKQKDRYAEKEEALINAKEQAVASAAKTTSTAKTTTSTVSKTTTSAPSTASKERAAAKEGALLGII